MIGSGRAPRYWEEGHLSFSGSCFLGIYSFGVVIAFKRFAPHITSRKALGASSGAIASSTITSGLPLEETINSFMKMAIHCRSFLLGPFDPRFNIRDMVHDDLTEHFPKNAHQLSRGKLFVSMTRMSTMKNEQINEFGSVEELVQALEGTCYIPYILGMRPAKLRGSVYLDGGFTDNLPVHDENTITVCPFTCGACIKPDSKNAFFPDTIYTVENVIRLGRALFAVSPDSLEDIFRQGYEQALDFIRQHDLYACSSCAQLPHRPRRGNCKDCEALLTASFGSEIPCEYLRPLRRAQEAEKEQALANPRMLSRVIDIFASLTQTPLEAATKFVEKAYLYLDTKLNSSLKKYLSM